MEEERKEGYPLSPSEVGMHSIELLKSRRGRRKNSRSGEEAEQGESARTA